MITVNVKQKQHETRCFPVHHSCTCSHQFISCQLNTLHPGLTLCLPWHQVWQNAAYKCHQKRYSFGLHLSVTYIIMKNHEIFVKNGSVWGWLYFARFVPLRKKFGQKEKCRKMWRTEHFWIAIYFILCVQRLRWIVSHFQKAKNYVGWDLLKLSPVLSLMCMFVKFRQTLHDRFSVLSKD